MACLAYHKRINMQHCGTAKTPLQPPENTLKPVWKNKGCRFAFQYGPFRPPKWPILEAETGHIGKQNGLSCQALDCQHVTDKPQMAQNKVARALPKRQNARHKRYIYSFLTVYLCNGFLRRLSHTPRTPIPQETLTHYRSNTTVVTASSCVSSLR